LWTASALAITAVMVLSAGLTGAVSIHITTAADRNSAGPLTGLLGGESKMKRALKSFTVGEGPLWPAYDPTNHYLYIPEATAEQIQVFNTANRLVAAIGTGSDTSPLAAAFDPQNNYVYVTNSEDPGSVWVISGTSIIDTITSPQINVPLGITYDPGDAVMAVANWGGNDVAFLSGESVVSVTHVGTGPQDVAFDPYWSNLIVTNERTDNVTCINSENLDVDGNIAVGSSPTGIAFDPATSQDYVANYYSKNVTVISGSCTGPNGNIKGFDDPDDVAFQQSTLEMFVTNAGGATTSAISSAGKIVHTYAVGTGPSGLAYSDYTNDVYVTDYDGGIGTTVYVIT